MNNKRLSYLLSILLLTILITSPVLIVGAAPPYQGETDDELTNDLTNQYVDPEGDNPAPLTDGMFTYLEAPYFSDDGNSLHNANLPRLLIADPNPEMQDLRFPQNPDIAAAIAGTRSTGATFSITYKASGSTDPWGYPCITFPTSARTAFAAAAAIWASRIQSSVPITISACWTNSLPSGVLGGSGGGTYHRDFSGAPMPNTWYQAALANSLAGSDLDTTNADMHITYSASFNWYYGTDGNTTAGQYDLLSVAAHEIAHGLHFSGMMEYSGGEARYGWGSGYPSIYETFMESGSGTKLTSYTNPSTALGTLVTSNNLWWNGTHANTANGGGRVKMYAPAAWSPGSSYSHLDYTTFSGTINSLMVYAIGSGSSQHNPGLVTMGILEDMGWRTGSPPPIPTGVAASDGTYTDKVRVTWNASSGATYYQVFRNTSNTHTGETTLTSSHSNSPYDDTSAVAGTTYYYWVKACNTAGCSGYSTVDTGFRSQSSGYYTIYLPLIINGGGSSPVNPLINGDFEAGPGVGWTEYSNHGEPIIVQFEPGAVHSGVWAAWMGGLHNSVDRLSQTVTIPSSTPYLHFWYWISSEDACGYDYAYIKIGSTTVAYAELCSNYNSSNWTHAAIPLDSYKGNTVNLIFEVTTDSSFFSSFYLDDVSLSSSATTSASELNQRESPPGLPLEKQLITD